MLDIAAYKSTEKRGQGDSQSGSSIRAGVLGGSGYAGAELLRLLARHSGVQAAIPFTRSDGSGASSDLKITNQPATGQKQLAWSQEALEGEGIDVLFLATPHEISRELVPVAAALGIRVIDLSGAWRLKRDENQSIYALRDADRTMASRCLQDAVYGLAELHRAEIADAKIVANPGCYATSAILGLAPLLQSGFVDLGRGVVCDSKSGVSGAGKAATERTHFVSVADNLSAYSVFTHRHVGEITEQLHITTESFSFTPHLLPIPRGILSTIYVSLSRQHSAAEIGECFNDFYAGEPWVRVLGAGSLPEIRHSLHTNYCDLGFTLAPDGKRLVVVSCLDNLMKGAAGQAIQNMNVMWGWDEKEGLL